MNNGPLAGGFWPAGLVPQRRSLTTTEIARLRAAALAQGVDLDQIRFELVENDAFIGVYSEGIKAFVASIRVSDVRSAILDEPTTGEQTS